MLQRALADRALAWLFGDHAHQDDPDVHSVRRRTLVGVAAVAAASVLLGGLHALGTPPFQPPDETAHVAYALALSDGVIPHIAEFPESTPIPGMPGNLSIWVANHPPGGYLLLAAPLRLGMTAGAPLTGFFAARLLNVLAVAIGLVLVARTLLLVVPHRPRLAVGATAIAALPPYLVQVAGTAYTDSLAFLGACALLCVAVEVLVRGPSRRLLALLALLAAAAALLRLSLLVLVVLAGTAWAVGVWLHSSGPWSRRLRDGIGGAALVGLAAALAAGWFYLGNLDLYGDPGGTAALMSLHDRAPRGSVWSILTSSQEYRFQELQLWSKYEGDGYVVSGYFVQDAHKVVLAVLWTCAAVVAVRLRRWRTLDAGRVAGIVLLAVWWWALFVGMATFVSQGGAPHARYLWPGIAGLALVLATGLDAWRVRDRPAGLLLAVGTLVWANLQSWPRYLELSGVVPGGYDFARAAVEVLAVRQVPGAGWVAGLLLAGLVTALGLLVAVLWRLPVRCHEAVAGTPPPGPPVRVGQLVGPAAGGPEG